MKVCYFGIYNPVYPRNKVLINGLVTNGVEVLECNEQRGFLGKYWRLMLRHWRLRKKYDVMVVGFLGQVSIILARLLTIKPIVLDAFVSLYDSNILDRKLYQSQSWHAKWYWLLDWLSCRLADVVLLDTDAHIDYFASEFGIPRERFRRVFVGSDDRFIHPLFLKPRTDGNFLVRFHGTFVPLHGIEYIVQAARILEKKNISFELLGDGQVFDQVERTVKNLGLGNVKIDRRFVSYNDLNYYLAGADLCLGIFGDTGKAQRVIPNKAYEAIAASRRRLLESYASNYS